MGRLTPTALALVLWLPAWSGCNDSLDLETFSYSCIADDQCATGFRCDPAAGICVQQGQTVADVPHSDAAPDTDATTPDATDTDVADVADVPVEDIPTDGGTDADVPLADDGAIATDADAIDTPGDGPLPDSVTPDAQLDGPPTSCTVDGDCDDGLACTNDACVFTQCAHAPTSGFCYIGGACHGNAATNPADVCLVCLANVNPTTWSPAPGGKACDDGDGCTLGDSCAIGACVAGPPADCSDGLACTEDLCESTAPDAFQCTNPLTTGSCLIAGTCYADGADNPASDCQSCESGTVVDTWTDKVVDTVCGPCGVCDGAGSCTLGDRACCSSAGVCAAGTDWVCGFAQCADAPGTPADCPGDCP